MRSTYYLQLLFQYFMRYKLLILIIFCFSCFISRGQNNSNITLPQNIQTSIIPNNLMASEAESTNIDAFFTVNAICYDSISMVRISWVGPAGFKSFDVYRNEILIASNLKTTFYLDSAVMAAAYYHYTITAKNGKEAFNSNSSAEVFVKPCQAATVAVNPFQISVSPNPSPSIFYFSASNLRNKIIQIEILSGSGTRVYSHQTKSMASDFIQTIDLNNVPSGNYFLKVQIDRNTYFKQIVKQ